MAVLILLLLMGDVVRRLFREFGDHPGGDDPDFGSSVPAPDTNDVHESAAPCSRGRTWPLIRTVECGIDRMIAGYAVLLSGVLTREGLTTLMAFSILVLMGVLYTPREERRADINEVSARLREHLAEVADIKTYLQPVQDLAITTRVNYIQYQFTLGSTNTEGLSLRTRGLPDRLVTALKLEGLSSDLQDQGLHVTASHLGVSLAVIDNTLDDAFGQRLISTIFTQSNQYRIFLEADRLADKGLAALDELRVPAANGSQVPLSSLAHVSERTPSHQPPSAVPGHHPVVQPGVGLFLGTGCVTIEKAGQSWRSWSAEPN